MTSSTRLSAVIMAHPTRKAFVSELQAKLDGDVPVVWDEKNDRWDTGRRSMLAYDPEASHHLVLQDDAVIPHDLLAGLEKAITHTPEAAPLCLYIGKVRPDRAAVQRLVRRADRVKNTSWIVMSHLHWGVGIVMPTRLIDRMVRWGDTRSDITNYDKRIGRWCQLRRIPVYYPWPSLVDHRNSPSLVPGRNPKGLHRRAHAFIGAGASALDADFSGDEVHALPPSLVRRYRREIS